jgi:hypothetical protein
MHFQVEPGSVTRRTLTLKSEDSAASRLRFSYDPKTMANFRKGSGVLAANGRTLMPTTMRELVGKREFSKQ